MKQCRHFKTYKAVYEPRCGCSACWYKYFASNMGVSIAVDSIVRKFGRKKAVERYGDTFMRFFYEWCDVTKEAHAKKA